MNNGRIILGAILVIVGISALLDINIWPLLWPLFLIFVGLRILGQGGEKERRWEKATEEKGDEIDETVILNGINKRITSDHFTGGKITAVFGGGEIDLREVKMDEDKKADLEVATVFGGMKIIIPETWEVVDKLTGVAGNLENKTRTPKTVDGKLIINGTAFFGGVEVSN